MEPQLSALVSSSRRLVDLVADLDDQALTASAYPTEWSIADTLSHLGSGAVIFRRLVEDAVAGRTTPDDLAPSVWDEWNAKTPRQQADEFVTADRAYVDLLLGLTDAERASVTVSMGPMELDATQLAGMRLNEHALHSWDVAVALDPAATIPTDATDVVVDSLAMVAGWTAKATGSDRTITVRTEDPTRTFVLTLTPDEATFGEGADDATADLTLPAEAFVRLVYGRLDPDHTPAGVTGDLDALDELRAVFPGP